MAKTRFTQDQLERLATRVETRFAIALSAIERADQDDQTRYRTLDFVAKAARAGDMKLAERSQPENESLISVHHKEVGAEIAVSVVAEGLAKVNEYRNRKAHLFTANGVIRYTFQFDARGQAAFRLSSDPDVVAALRGGFSIDIL